MKKASKLLEEALEDFELKGVNARDCAIKAMKEYAEQACEEQRKICYQKYVDMPKDSELMATAILIARQPELK